MSTNLQSTGIATHNDHDVLCGRGGGSYKHLGNSTYRHLVNLNKELYLSCKKHEKIKISQAIVAAIRSQEPPGRFLEKDASTGLWYDIGDKKAIEKTSQALREGAPKLRKKLATGESKGKDVEGNGPALLIIAPPELETSDGTLKSSPKPSKKALPQIHSQAPQANPMVEPTSGIVEQNISLPNSMAPPPARPPQLAQNLQQFGQSQSQFIPNVQNESKVHPGLCANDQVNGGDNILANPNENLMLDLGQANNFNVAGLDDGSDAILNNMLNQMSSQQPPVAGINIQTRRNLFRNSAHSVLTDYSDMLDSIASFDMDDNIPFDGDKRKSSLSARFSLGSMERQSKKGLFRGSNHSVLTDFSDISEALESIQMEEDEDALDQDGDRSRRTSVRFSFSKKNRQGSARRKAFALNEFSKIPSGRSVANDCEQAIGALDYDDEDDQDMQSVSRNSIKSRGSSVRFSLPKNHGERGMSTLLRRSIMSDFSCDTQLMDELEALDRGEGTGGEAPMMVWDVSGTHAAAARRKSSVNAAAPQG